MYCLVENRPLHVVVAENPVGNEAIVITVYEPDATIWEADFLLTMPCDTDRPFCHPAPARIIFGNPLVVALWDAFPVNRGHALIIPRRHVPTWFDASAEEQVALMAGGTPLATPRRPNHE